MEVEIVFVCENEIKKKSPHLVDDDLHKIHFLRLLIKNIS